MIAPACARVALPAARGAAAASGSGAEAVLEALEALDALEGPALRAPPAHGPPAVPLVPALRDNCPSSPGARARRRGNRRLTRNESRYHSGE